MLFSFGFKIFYPTTFFIGMRSFNGYLEVKLFKSYNKYMVRRICFYLFLFFYLPNAGAQSVLSQGNWFQLRISTSGVYRLTAADLRSMGINTSGLDPKTIRIYGHQEGMLDELPAASVRLDPPELPLMVVGESDGVLDESDQIYFYANGPHVWRYQPSLGRYEHVQHLYDEASHVFMTFGGKQGQRMSSLDAGVAVQSDSVSSIAAAMLFHESDQYNLSISGKEWLGERFGGQTDAYTFNHDLKEIQSGSSLLMKFRLAGRNPGGSGYFTLNAGGRQQFIPISALNINDISYIDEEWEGRFTAARNWQFTLSYARPNFNAYGYLGWYEIHYSRNLVFSGSQFDVALLNRIPGQKKEWRFQGSGFQVWDVSNAYAPAAQNLLSGASFSYFREVQGSKPRRLVCFDAASALKPEFEAVVSNQDVKALPPGELLIISHPDFLNQANTLAEHRRKQGLVCNIVAPQAVYREFSSSVQDISALRNFIRYQWNKSQSSAHPLKYVLLFGAASYDYKNRVKGNTNFVPVYQSDITSYLNTSFASDDFYGFLDSASGFRLFNGNMAVAVGRLPVRSAEEAEAVVAKIIHYDSPATLGEWRNRIAFAADDVDNDQWEFEFLNESESYAQFVASAHPEYNADKVYFDAFRQVNTGNTESYPDAQASINRNMSRGTLFFNYMGHGGEKGWAQEEVLTIPMIKNWTNRDRMPIMVTATCEFSRFDDPARQSAGELSLLHAEGGNVALLTTTRLTYNTGNKSINSSFWKEYGLAAAPGDMPSIGDIMRNVKNRGSRTDEDRKFALLGDPSLVPAFPYHQVKLDFINTKAAKDYRDTLKAFSKAIIEGHIERRSGAPFPEFNGRLYITVYDKVQVRRTLANDNPGSELNFKTQNTIIYKGLATVRDGKFKVEFMVPKDISYQVEFGKISMYAENGVTDASGYYNIRIGGSEQSLIADKRGPEIRLFLNDTTFRSGGIVSPDALALAFLRDVNGINATGNGIGRDLLLFVDKGTSSEQVFVVNDYYSADENSYSSGSIRFPLQNLSPGMHALTLRVWDIFNNPSEASINMLVSERGAFQVHRVAPYPNPAGPGQLIRFLIEHNAAGMDLDAELIITDLSGRQLHRSSKLISSAEVRTGALTWNPAEGSAGNGIFLYRIRLRTSAGAESVHYGRIICTQNIR